MWQASPHGYWGFFSHIEYQGPAEGREDIHATPTPAAGPQIFNSKAGIGD